jgi:hypothetical protein
MTTSRGCIEIHIAGTPASRRAKLAETVGKLLAFAGYLVMHPTPDTPLLTLDRFRATPNSVALVWDTAA